MRFSSRSVGCQLLGAAILAGSTFAVSEAQADALAGRQLRAEAGTVLAADLHLLAERESRRRGISLPAIVGPGESIAGPSLDRILYRDGMVNVVIGSENPSDLVSAVQARGMTEILVYEDLNHLRGRIPLENVFQLEDLKDRGLLSVQAELMPMTSRGATTSQADWLMEVDRVRDSTGGYTGAGQRIGVLSDSYNRLGGAPAGVASGDLPATVTILQEGPASSSDEGRAMVELIYDLAPGATYAFASAFHGEGVFASNIQALAANTAFGRCTVIVDDVFWAWEPFFQDGIIAQAINDVVTNRNVTYFSAAGNMTNQAWESVNPQFVNATTALVNGANLGFVANPNVYTWLDFDPGPGITPYQTVTLPASSLAELILQWDDPYYAPNNVENDLDVYVVNAATGALVANSVFENREATAVYESVLFLAGSSTTFRIYIGRWIANPLPSIGPGPNRIKWVNIGSNRSLGLTNISFATQGPTIIPHAASANAMAVGAVNYWAQQAYADFTSKGPATIFFNPNGTRLGSPVVRNKPDMAALQGTNTTFFGGVDPEGDGFPNFSGTSAAAPHAAAIAALVRQRFPGESPAQIYQRLKNSADPLSNPADRVGAGLINAWKAMYGDPVPVEPPYATGFETGFLDIEWDTRRTGSQRAQVTGANNPAAGDKHLILHGTRPFFNGRSEATLHVDLTGYENVQLSFLHRRATGEAGHAMPATFTGSSNTDGVAYSVDGGTTWKRIVSLTGTNSTPSTQPFNFDLSALAATNGDSLDGLLLIRFQEYDSQPAPTRGHYHDEIVLMATPIGEGLPGDVNNDGVVNVGDVTLLRLFLEGRVESVPGMGNADFNGDGIVDADDAGELIGFIVNE